MCLFRSVILFLFTLSAAWTGIEFRWHIHSPRWEVKTLADGFIPDTVAVTTTVQEQISLPALQHVSQSWKRLPSERTLYVLDARLLSVMEDLDRDYKLDIEDPTTHAKMIAEIPDPAAYGPERYRPAFFRARHFIDSIAGEPPTFAETRVAGQPLVRITGIGFFDQPHFIPSDSAAPNNREIHPVLTIALVR